MPVVKLDTMVQARVDLKNKSTRPQKAATSIPHNSQASKRQTELPYTTYRVGKKRRRRLRFKKQNEK